MWALVVRFCSWLAPYVAPIIISDTWGLLKKLWAKFRQNKVDDKNIKTETDAITSGDLDKIGEAGGDVLNGNNRDT